MRRDLEYQLYYQWYQMIGNGNWEKKIVNMIIKYVSRNVNYVRRVKGETRLTQECPVKKLFEIKNVFGTPPQLWFKFL